MNTQQLLAFYKESVMNFHGQQKAPATDCALAALFDANQEAILKEANFDVIDPNAFEFHKSFRRETSFCGHTHSAIWFLLQDAPIFRMVVKANGVVSPKEEQTRKGIRNQ